METLYRGIRPVLIELGKPEPLARRARSAAPFVPTNALGTACTRSTCPRTRLDVDSRRLGIFLDNPNRGVVRTSWRT